MKRIRVILFPFSLLYGLIVRVRNLFFDIGLLKIQKAGVPVISVGNISSGGTGKTPIVEMLIDRLQQSSAGTIAVVSRGYGRQSTGTVLVQNAHGKTASIEEAGDELSQLAKKFPNLLIVADEQRVRGAQAAAAHGAEIILLDDGFQHRYLHRDLDLVVLPFEDLKKGDMLLPAGNRREPISALRRSDLIIISRCRTKEDVLAAGQAELRSFHKPLLGVRTVLKSFRDASARGRIEQESWQKKRSIAVSGIGNPASFEEILADAGIEPVRHLVYPDHHWFSERDVKHIIEVKKGLNAEYIFTTEKDAVRMQERFGDFLKSENVIITEIQQRIVTDEKVLETLMERITTKQ